MWDWYIGECMLGKSNIKSEGITEPTRRYPICKTSQILMPGQLAQGIYSSNPKIFSKDPHPYGTKKYSNSLNGTKKIPSYQ